ncbi:hypothetical protein I7I50_10871 [Histoplasma capsulatum G186AR]|uniref:Uncharacterized protein n=1 Tax=Ajellomyces capsulatus TaxID=5037 RepID=A0A8H7Z710_AJECA|nr:hypothetical protein I7I52_02110 [Histoplasma capsulatum]QSS69549.1 hypothetical protein I7I50_10871 [Histoplasma capsulatum G186AR]
MQRGVLVPIVPGWMRRNRLPARRQMTSFDNQNVTTKDIHASHQKKRILLLSSQAARSKPFEKTEEKPPYPPVEHRGLPLSGILR